MSRERLGIAGLGLIGGSLALALRRKPGGPEIWGYDRRAEQSRLALARGAIDRACGERDLAACDIVLNLRYLTGHTSERPRFSRRARRTTA